MVNNKLNIRLTLAYSFVASTVSVRTLTKKLMKQPSGTCFFFYQFLTCTLPNSFYNLSKLSLETIGWGKLLGRTLRPRNTFKGGTIYGK